MIGKKFGKLTVLELAYKKQKYSSYKNKIVKDGYVYYYKCTCECGKICIVEKYKLKRGHTQSCGCLKKNIGKLNYKHGMEQTRLYHIWQGIKRRCLNPNEIGYKKYGAKGITICEEWKDDSTAFIEWALKNGYSDKLTIDRINNLKGYSPKNCRWATPKQQARNTKKNHFITYKNETHCIAEWAEILEVPYYILSGRLSKGWNIEKAFEQPIRICKGGKYVFS